MSKAASPDEADAFRMFYEQDRILRLTLHLDGGATRSITTKVLKLHEPFTLSCALTVQVLCSETGGIEIPAQAILKLFDRRFSDQLRSDDQVEPWSEATEQKFVEFVSGGKAATFVKRLREDDDFKEPEEGWSPAEKEAYLYDECSDLFSTEVRAYDVLRSLQGKQIPKLYSTVSISLNSDLPDEALLTINGLLLEYIPGPTLSEMSDTVPREKWQSIVDDAVKVVRDYAPLGIRNKDVRPANFIVNGAGPDDDQHRVVMLDFALCEFRDPEQSDAEWGRAKWTQDEEGAVGAVMRTRLGHLGFDLKFENSWHWMEYANGEDDD